MITIGCENQALRFDLRAANRSGGTKVRANRWFALNNRTVNPKGVVAGEGIRGD
ncbi:MAG TPA: hypothetical protein VK217_12975 [Acidimicrobiales bacterium]|nr:hypothetical protein [Acidimicrobiales bacterium]